MPVNKFFKKLFSNNLESSLKGFSQLEKLINNFFVVKVARINKKLLNIRKDNLSVSLTGFTLIELLTAIAVFFIGILGAFSLSLHNLNTVKENFNRVIAADLAREGIEIVRNVRDSNWLKIEANIDSDPGTPGVIDLYTWDYGLSANNFFALDYRSDALTPLAGSTVNDAVDQPGAKLYLKNGFYTDDNSGQGTIFSRALGIKAICLSKQSINGHEQASEIIRDLSCPLPEIKIGLQITSLVKYTYGSKTNQVEVAENIYNWRQW